MKNKWLIYIIGVGLLSACTTEVDLCYGDHPHRSLLDIRFNWGDYAQVRPDSMYIVAIRPVNRLKYGFLVSSVPDVTTKKIEGQLLFPLSERIETENNKKPDEPAEPEQPVTPPEEGPGADEPIEDQPVPAAGEDQAEDETDETVLPDKHLLWLRNGEYKMVAYNGTNEEVESSLTNFALNEYADLEDLEVKYKIYETPDELPEGGRYKNWIDRNPYSGYVQGDVKPIFYSTNPSFEVPVSESASGKVVCNFTPRPVTQKIKVAFDIVKKENGVKVDSVQAELSGVASAIHLGSGYLKADKTYKVLFTPTYARKDSLHVMAPLQTQGEVNVTGLVCSYSPSLVTGPGIMQVNIYAETVDDNGRTVHRVFKAGINLYHLLQKNPSIEKDPSTEQLKQVTDKLTLRIAAPLEITRDKVLENRESGLDYWKGLETLDLDI